MKQQHWIIAAIAIVAIFFIWKTYSKGKSTTSNLDQHIDSTAPSASAGDEGSYFDSLGESLSAAR